MSSARPPSGIDSSAFLSSLSAVSRLNGPKERRSFGCGSRRSFIRVVRSARSAFHPYQAAAIRDRRCGQCDQHSERGSRGGRVIAATKSVARTLLGRRGQAVNSSAHGGRGSTAPHAQWASANSLQVREAGDSSRTKDDRTDKRRQQPERNWKPCRFCDEADRRWTNQNARVACSRDCRDR